MSRKVSKKRIIFLFITLFFIQGFNIYCQKQVLNHLPDHVNPVIGAWFWTQKEFTPDGYKPFIDQINKHSCYDLLTVGIRLSGRDITDIDVHNQAKLAVEYAKNKGIKIALDLDPRLASRKFESLYPNELQESLWLKEIELSKERSIETVIQSIDLSDHMTGSRTPYISLKGRLVRVYSYEKTTQGIDFSTLNDITTACEVTNSSKDSLVVRLPINQSDKPRQVCVMATFTHLVPDVFSPNLKEFTRKIIKSYADIPLAGGMRDEFGFPPSIPAERMLSGNHFWYSESYASAYSRATRGRNLVDDCLLMAIGIKGKEQERIMAINHYMKLNWMRNKELEEDFYNTIKKEFGENAVVVTHPTWYPYPNRLEGKKNGLYWWVAKRDWAQTDEVTPIAIRTALTKKWNSPIWYNQYYSEGRADYEIELWSSVLAGGRLNYHSLYPQKDNSQNKYTELFRGKLMRAESRVRLLNLITKSPIFCPVAVVFGHAATLNWATSQFDNVGMELVNHLWSIGIATDLIPSSEIDNGNLKVNEDGYIYYGKQKYAAVVLFHPEFEKESTAIFFNQVKRGKTSLFRLGDWTMDFNGNPINGNKRFHKQMLATKDINTTVAEIYKVLKQKEISIQTPATRLLKGFGYVSNMPPTSGFCRLIDGTYIQASGVKDLSGDTIRSNIKINNHKVEFDALGVVAVRLNEKGEVDALSAGGLKLFKSKKLKILLEERIDLALWRNKDGSFEGIIQGYEGEIPQSLLTITNKWTRLQLPSPVEE
ncbi:MAG: hypothetical protein PHX50_03485 [Massilibacteroides sp.]|nr:hypothetical protein [Massilibacteroides sp.]